MSGNAAAKSGQKRAAASNDEMQRASDRAGEMHEMLGVPGGAAGPARPGGELKRNVGHFRPRRDVIPPAFPIPVRPRVHVQRRRQSFLQEFFMHDQDSLLAVQVVPSRLVDE